ncbi:hypothetical protein QCA50_007599 [Cerrena zonata]|uniref:Uncharacterized protein n=1 Tax=Cerrena zonata TaxID=2478898 RepID=A0AAW0GFM0_9APHY
MPSILRSLILLLAAASLPLIQARPLHPDPASPRTYTEDEPASLLGRQYLHLSQNQKRVIIMPMDPALGQGFQTPDMKSSSLPTSSHQAHTSEHKSAEKIKSRDQPMPFAQIFSRDTNDAGVTRSNHGQQETHPESYLSNVNPGPPTPPAVPAPPPAGPSFPHARYQPFGSEHESKKDEGKSKSKAKSKGEKKEKGSA